MISKLQHVLWFDSVWKIVYLFFIEYTLLIQQKYNGITFISLCENGLLRNVFIVLFLVPHIIYYTLKVKEYCWNHNMIIRLNSLDKIRIIIYKTLILYFSIFYFIIFFSIVVIHIIFSLEIDGIWIKVVPYFFLYYCILFLFSIIVLGLFLLIMHVTQNVGFAIMILYIVLLAPTILKLIPQLYKYNIRDWFYYLTLERTNGQPFSSVILMQLVIMLFIMAGTIYIEGKTVNYKDYIF